MRVALAYACVVLIWATTPLGINWSNSTLSFAAAVALRMCLALAICWLALAVMRERLVQQRSDWKAFFAGAIGLYPNMLLVYWSAQFIPSGLMAVILGLYPFTAGLFTYFILKEWVFTPPRIVALVLAVTGLGVIHYEHLALGSDAIYGIMGMLGSTFLFGLSSVWLKASGAAVEPLRQSTGTLLLSTPFFILSWVVTGANIPAVIDVKSIVGVSYLAVAGSAIGGTLFFYVLKKCSMSSVSLITLMTPMMALTIGMLFNNETVTQLEFIGCIIILFSLAIYQGALRVVVKQINRLLAVGKQPVQLP